MKSLLKILISFGLAQSAMAANYNFNKLRFTDFEALRNVKSTAIKTSRKFNYKSHPTQAQRPLKEALKMFFSRPNTDNSIRKLTPDIESELRTMGLYEKTLRELINDCNNIYTKSNLDLETRATGVLCINNLLIEIKPKIVREVNLARVVCELADQSLSVPKEIKNSIQLTSKLTRQSPSTTAQEIMHWYAAKKNKKVSAQSEGCPFSKRAT